MLVNHRIKAYQSCERALAPVEPIQGTHPDATDNYRLEKLAALWCRFLRERLLRGSTAGHFASNQCEESQLNDDEMAAGDGDGRSDVDDDATQEKNSVEERLGDAGPEDGPQSLSSIMLVTAPGIFAHSSPVSIYTDCDPLFQKDSIQETSTNWRNTSMNPTSHMNSIPFFIPFDTPTAQFLMMLKIVSISVARSMFFILLLHTSMPLVTFVILAGCTISAFGAIPHGTDTHDMILFLLSKMRICWGCGGCSLHEFTFYSRSQIMRLMKVEN
jgi:hypothetical protein